LRLHFRKTRQFGAALIFASLCIKTKSDIYFKSLLLFLPEKSNQKPLASEGALPSVALLLRLPFRAIWAAADRADYSRNSYVSRLLPIQGRFCEPVRLSRHFITALPLAKLRLRHFSQTEQERPQRIAVVFQGKSSGKLWLGERFARCNPFWRIGRIVNVRLESSLEK